MVAEGDRRRRPRWSAAGAAAVAVAAAATLGGWTAHEWRTTSALATPVLVHQYGVDLRIDACLAHMARSLLPRGAVVAARGDGRQVQAIDEAIAAWAYPGKAATARWAVSEDSGPCGTKGLTATRVGRR